MPIPQIKSVTLTTTRGTLISGVMIPVSHKLSILLDDSTNELKTKHDRNRDQRVKLERNRFAREVTDDEDLIKAYIESRAAAELRRNNGGTEVTAERITKVAEQARERYIKGKTSIQLLTELAEMYVDILELKDIMDNTLLTTLWYCLRKVDNDKERIFASIDDLMDSISTTQLYDVYTKNITEAAITEEELKKQQSPPGFAQQTSTREGTVQDFKM